MGKIIIIGGGEMSRRETLRIDTEIVSLTGKRNPKALFIPTASGESEEYVKSFHNIYGKKLGCTTDVLYLLKTKPSVKELQRKVLSADLIYVGGGNTLKMMRRWRLLELDRVLKEAYYQGIVLSGISAGSICWFESGHSDSMGFYHPAKWSYIRVRGIGLIKGTHCPHFNGRHKGKARSRYFLEFVQKHALNGIALDDNCAIAFIDGKFRVI